MLIVGVLSLNAGLKPTEFPAPFILHASANGSFLFAPDMWLNLNCTHREWRGVCVCCWCVCCWCTLGWSSFDAVWSAVNLPFLWPWHNLREKETEPWTVIQMLDMKVKDEIRYWTGTGRIKAEPWDSVDLPEWDEQNSGSVDQVVSYLLMSWYWRADTV